jgi:hypothetical protein
MDLTASAVCREHFRLAAPPCPVIKRPDFGRRISRDAYGSDVAGEAVSPESQLFGQRTILNAFGTLDPSGDPSPKSRTQEDSTWAEEGSSKASTLLRFL